jgi:hypothetical protein
LIVRPRATARTDRTESRARLSLGVAFWLVAVPAAAQTPPPAACVSPPYRSFDFWIGEWDVFLPDGNRAGSNRIESTEGGCLLVERWSGATGSTGMSVNYFDPGKARWVQLWVSSDGTVIAIDGNVVDGSMVLVGTLTGPRGAVQPFRGRWTPNQDGSVRQHFEISADGGTSWTTWFDSRYVRR